MAGKCLLVTGPPGVGKTTLIIRVLDMLSPRLKIQGFYTQEMREGNERVGFEVVTLDGRKSMLASSAVSSPESLRWPSVGKYKVDIASFESIALPELQVKDDTHLFIMDEVGKMELFSPSFFPAVLRVLESNIPLLASIPTPKFGPHLPAVARLKNHPGVAVVTLSASNRDSMKEHILMSSLDGCPSTRALDHVSSLSLSNLKPHLCVFSILRFRPKRVKLCA